MRVSPRFLNRTAYVGVLLLLYVSMLYDRENRLLEQSCSEWSPNEKKENHCNIVNVLVLWYIILCMGTAIGVPTPGRPTSFLIGPSRKKQKPNF